MLYVHIVLIVTHDAYHYCGTLLPSDKKRVPQEDDLDRRIKRQCWNILSSLFTFLSNVWQQVQKLVANILPNSHIRIPYVSICAFTLEVVV